MTPSELLSAAADRVRDLAAYFGDYAKAAEFTLPNGQPRFESAEEAWLYDVLDRNAPRDGAAWVAAMSPEVAPDLSALLCALEERDYDAARVIAQRLSRAILGVELAGETP